MDVEDKTCPECRGTKWRIVGDKAQACVCLKRSMIDNFLGPDLAGAPQIRTGPLYAVEVANGVVLDRTSDNLLIKSGWAALRPHLRLALGYRHYVEQTFRYVILTDERVLNVYVGNERYGSRSRKIREDQDSFNGLKDLIEGPPLVIVRLNFIGHKNIAAPGALKQALMIREVAHKPTWIIYDPNYDTPISWNEEVVAYVHEHFEVVDFKKLGVPSPPSGPPTMEVEEHELPAPRPKPQPPPRREESHASSDEDPEGMPGVAQRRQSFRLGGNYKKRGGNSSGSGGGDMPPV